MLEGAWLPEGTGSRSHLRLRMLIFLVKVASGDSSGSARAKGGSLRRNSEVGLLLREQTCPFLPPVA